MKTLFLRLLCALNVLLCALNVYHTVERWDSFENNPTGDVTRQTGHCKYCGVLHTRFLSI